MADPVVTLDSARVAVEPGGQASITATITNTGTIVEGYAVEILGEPADWAQATPAEVSVYPQQTATAVINFSPPAGSAVPGGATAFGVRVRSVVDADAVAVAEGDVDVDTVLSLQAEISPATSTGRLQGRHVVRISNTGNAPARLRMRATDPDEALGFLVRPDEIEVAMGGSASVRVDVRTRKPFLRGSPVKLPFQVIGEPPVGETDENADADPDEAPVRPAQPGVADPGRPTVDATLNQKPILTRAVVIFAGLALLAMIAGFVYAWTRPQPVAAFAELGTPAAPELTATAAGADTVRLSWSPIDRVQGYRLLTIDPATSNVGSAPLELAPDQTQTEVKDLTPESEHCFQIQSVRGDLQSPRSELACANTEAAAPTASPSLPGGSAPAAGASSAAGQPTTAPAGPGQPTGAGPPGASTGTSGGASSPPAPSASNSADPLLGGTWIAAAELFGQPASLEVPEQLVEELELAGLPAKILDSTDYPQLRWAGLPIQPSTVVYVGTFETEAEAMQMCTTIDQLRQSQPVCQPAQPDPPQ